jgi:hypothetical protein
MRTDEAGNPCPSTLGEYRDMCAAIGGEFCEAVRFLDKRIAEQGREEEVIAPDLQMRMLLLPMLTPGDGGPVPNEPPKPQTVDELVETFKTKNPDEILKAITDLQAANKAKGRMPGGNFRYKGVQMRDDDD